ncbi:MAG: putative lysophospholipase L1 biosynthesis ABC-type transport system permease subunit [Arenicella sp.]|jgi:predicted lysophospholipase L1 biosynthesis ABC-type transport system permease subunit
MAVSTQEQLEALSDIRSMMEQSSRFISLSGLSGIFAGITALVGAGLAYLRINNSFSISSEGRILKFGLAKYDVSGDIMADLMLIALATLIIAIAFGIFFTTRNARKKNQKIWDSLTKRLVANLFIPLATGGVFCLILMYRGYVGIIASSTLIFYGVALINASKYTLKDIWYLGICQIVLGLLAAMYVGYGLLFWSIGFGVLHIAYGTYMYVKYESDHDSQD